MNRRLSVLLAAHCCLAPLAALVSAQAQNPKPSAPPPGFVALFDGHSLDGWQGGSTADPRKISPDTQKKWNAQLSQHWRVEGDQLVSDGHEPHLATLREYGDMELHVDWKLAPQGDSGIYLRGCPQVQIWDPGDPSAIQNGADKGSGGLWNNQTHPRFPTVVADKPVGQWNHMTVRMAGPYVRVTLNDQTVVDDVIMENYYDRALPVFAKGPIHLQTHGSEMRFRNLFVREIPQEESAKLLAQIEGGEADFKPLFNGKDLNGWEGATANYEAKNGEIRCRKGTGGNLVTTDDYDNFVVRFEFKLPPGGNNGLAIRTPGSQVDAAYQGIELQILDNDAPQYAELQPYQYHGSAYGLATAHRGYLRPTGEWNYEQVTVDGDRVQVRLNGYLILDADLAEARAKPLDGNEHPGASRKTGRVGFCGHGDPVAFRNIRIKRLP